VVIDGWPGWLAGRNCFGRVGSKVAQRARWTPLRPRTHAENKTPALGKICARTYGPAYGHMKTSANLWNCDIKNQPEAARKKELLNRIWAHKNRKIQNAKLLPRDRGRNGGGVAPTKLPSARWEILKYRKVRNDMSHFKVASTSTSTSGFGLL